MSNAPVESTLPEGQAQGPLAGARIDAPHVLGDAPPELEVRQSEGPEEQLAISYAELRTQSQQLAGHLRERQQEIDHREAKLNSHLAELEQQARDARLWLSLRSEELEEREEALNERERAIETAEERQQAARETAEAKQDRRGGELDQRADLLHDLITTIQAERCERFQKINETEEALQRRDDALRLQQQQIDAKRHASLELIRLRSRGLDQHRRSAEAALDERRRELAGLGASLDERGRRVERNASELDQQWRCFKEAESLLNQGQVELQLQRDQLAAAEAALKQRLKADQEQLTAQGERFTTETREQQRAIKRRASRLDAREAEMEQLQQELRHAQREALETRLATEELWAQLSGTMSPAALSKSVGRIRARLADHFRLASTDLDDQKEEMELLRLRLDDQHQNVAKQKRQVQEWVARRDAELQKQAEALVHREQELDAQDSQLKQSQQRWREERNSYQKQIRDLLEQRRPEQMPV